MPQLCWQYLGCGLADLGHAEGDGLAAAPEQPGRFLQAGSLVVGELAEMGFGLADEGADAADLLLRRQRLAALSGFLPAI